MLIKYCIRIKKKDVRLSLQLSSKFQYRHLAKQRRHGKGHVCLPTLLLLIFAAVYPTAPPACWQLMCINWAFKIGICASNFFNVYLCNQLINNTFCNAISIIRRYSLRAEMFSKEMKWLNSIFHDLLSHQNGNMTIYGIFDSYWVCQVSELVQACFISAQKL